MKKIQNKFIIFILIAVIIVIFFGVFGSDLFGKDRNSYAILIDGEGYINSEALEINDKEKLHLGDVVKTVGKSSLVVIEWGDGSVTRIGGDSSIKIDELFVDKDLLKINLSFELLEGKSWSNVINFMGEGSYFKESFRDIEAGVRGTVFNVDLENDYISVLKHKISLVKSDGSIFDIGEAMPFSLETFSFIELTEFIKNIKDKAFENLNNKYDEEYIENLKNSLQSKLDYFDSLADIDIKSLANEKKEALYDEIMEKYQQLNFLTSSAGELFDKKIEYKNALIELAQENEKIILIENALYDFKNSILSKDYSSIEAMLPVFSENIDIVQSFNVSFSDYFNNGIIPEDLKEIFAQNIEVFENIFGDDLLDKIQNIDLEYINQVKSTIETKIQENLDNNIGLFTKMIEFVKEYFK